VPYTPKPRCCVVCGTNRGEIHADRRGDELCVRCFHERHHDPLVPELPPAPRRSRRRDDVGPDDPAAAPRLIERIARVLGPAIATPEMISVGDGKRERARCRVFRWVCPACGAGYEDELELYRPFTVDTDGRVSCTASQCSPEAIAAAVKVSAEASAA
jgi:hypothetical protein